MALDEFTPEEQAQFEQMREADNVPPVIEPTPQPAEAAPEADTVAGAQQEQDQEAPVDKRPQMVPHAALHEERERRKAVELQIAEERRARQTLEERTNLLLQRLNLSADGQPQPAAPAAIPKIEDDPVGHLVGQLARQEQIIAGLAGAVQQRGQQDQQATALASIQQRAVIAEREFRQQTEDYDAAVAHLLTAREKVLGMAGYTDPAQRQQMMAREALDVANRALQMGLNPAQMIYELSEAHGYRKAAAAPAAEEVEQPAARARLMDRIETQTRGQQQDGRTLSGVRGSGPRPLTAQRLVEMGDAEFAKMMETPEGRELMGA